MSILSSVFILVAGIVIAAGFSLALAFPIKWCWNYTMPGLFGLDTVSWGQAWCLSFLAGCLIKTTRIDINKRKD